MNDSATTRLPGTELLVQQLGAGDPAALLLHRHPPGDPLHRLARALLATAADLDTTFAAAQQAGATLRQLRRDDNTHGTALNEAARHLELALNAAEILDTCLVRLLGSYTYSAPEATDSSNGTP